MNKLPKIETKTSTTREYTVTINRVALLEMLCEVLERKIGGSACVVVHIPGGGDWSDQDLEITDTCPITVRWTEKIMGG